MNLLRLIILTLVLWIAYRLWQNYRTNRKIKPPARKNKPGIPDMVACAVCDTHIPEQDALQKNGRYYCSQQHYDSDNPS